MTENLDGRGLKSIIEKYDLFFIDLWGVIHNGIELNKDAVSTLTKISELKRHEGKSFYIWRGCFTLFKE